MALEDAQRRPITYLRLSVNEACNFRCLYCSPAERDRGVLTADEIGRIVRVLASSGIRRVRITGGEPTLRKDLVRVVARVRAHVDDVAMTTNAARLAPLASDLRAAGLGALNVSLDTLDAERLRAISGKGAHLGDVLGGIDRALAAGLAVSLNTVVLGGVNDDELAALVRFAWARGARPRFIELMPFAQGTPVSAERMRARLASAGFALEPSSARGWGPARWFSARDEATGGAGMIGFIAPLGDNFCASCNRLRIGAHGEIRACLGGGTEAPLADLLRSGAGDEVLLARVRDALARKAPAHAMVDGRRRLLPMMSLGG